MTTTVQQWLQDSRGPRRAQRAGLHVTTYLGREVYVGGDGSLVRRSGCRAARRRSRGRGAERFASDVLCSALGD